VVPEGRLGAMGEAKWVKVDAVENIFEMDLVKDALDREGIDYSMKEHRDTAYDGIFILQKGYATLFVHEERLDEAREIVNRIKSMPYVAYPQD
jgi:hypothetical protein